ncbi:MAG: hypothetical protein HY291_19190 [Planctomycetes bacterium]|nr:hypothetical protein [Planctomycetota bacterium]
MSKPRKTSRPSFLNTDRTDKAPRAYLESIGRIFAEFGEQTQDSVNISYGIECAGESISSRRRAGPITPRRP